MTGSARLTSLDAGGGRRRRVGAPAADTAPKLSLVAFLATLCFPIFLTPSHALRCSCNDQTPLSDCRWEEWTCTIDTSRSACFNRRSVRDDGSIRTDLGCVYTAWNPTFCSKTTETVAIECCVEGDMCNEDLNPTLLPPVDTPPPSVNTTDGSGAVTPTPTDGSGALTPTPTVSPQTPQGQLKCKCSPPLCDQSYCHTDYKCYKSASFNSNDQEEIMFGCYEDASVDRFGACNGTLDTSTHKIRCCNDNDMCNEDLDVSLVGPGSNPPTQPMTTPPPPSPPPGLRCECSPSRCPNGQTWCHSNYSCFRQIKLSDTTNTFEHILGCIDTIEQANLDKIGVCNGRLDTQTSTFKCCSDRDMCNRDLPIETPSTDQGTPSTDQGPTSPAGGDDSLSKDNNQGKDDNDLFIVMSVVVILVMVVVTVLVVAMVSMFCLHYQREKTKVMSVDQFSPPNLKQLSNSSITCSIIPSQHPQKDHTEINNYV